MNPKLEQMSAEMIKAISASEQEAIVDLWQVDFREFGGEVFYFCNQKNEKGAAVVWQGQPYEPYPIKADGFEMSAQGSGNRPALTVSNLLGFVTGAAEQFNQFVGVTVIRKQVYAKFLDSQNFDVGNASADPTQEVVSKFIIERMTSMDYRGATFELSMPSEADGSVIPSRIMLANVCSWQYRGEGCGYTGRAVADRFDLPTSVAEQDVCSKTLTGCRARFGATAVLPFGGWPSSDKVGT